MSAIPTINERTQEAKRRIVLAIAGLREIVDAVPSPVEATAYELIEAAFESLKEANRELGVVLENSHGDALSSLAPADDQIDAANAARVQ